MSKLEALVMRCREPARLASFYSEVLGLPIDAAAAAAITDGTLGAQEAVLIGARDSLHIWLMPVAAEPTDSPAVHFDVRLDDATERDAFVALGAEHRWYGTDRRWEVLADPEGNLFCVFPPEPAEALP